MKQRVFSYILNIYDCKQREEICNKSKAEIKKLIWSIEGSGRSLMFVTSTVT